MRSRRGPPTRFGGPAGNVPGFSADSAPKVLATRRRIADARDQVSSAVQTLIHASQFGEEHEHPAEIAERTVNLLEERPVLRQFMQDVAKIADDGTEKQPEMPETLIAADPGQLALSLLNVLQGGADGGPVIEGEAEEIPDA